jgi:hypothetical protein
VGQALAELCDALAACFRVIPALKEAANQAETMRTALVAAFAFGVLDDILLSTKLLLTGKLPAAGNLMRQVIEGIAMSALCTSDAPLVVAEKTKRMPAAKALYWERLDDDDPCTWGHLALRQLVWNARAFGGKCGCGGPAAARQGSLQRFQPLRHGHNCQSCRA